MGYDRLVGVRCSIACICSVTSKSPHCALYLYGWLTIKVAGKVASERSEVQASACQRMNDDVVVFAFSPVYLTRLCAHSNLNDRALS